MGDSTRQLRHERRPGTTVDGHRSPSCEKCAVLVANLDHLSSSTPVRQAIQAEIEQAGGQVLTVAAPGHVPMTEAGRTGQPT
jgi:hypothetical protein